MKKSLIWDFSDYEHTEKNYAREPVIEIMPDGSLVCVMLTGGTTEPHNKNIVVICRSTDGGESWSAPEILFKHKNRGVWATEIYTGFDKPMMILYTYNAECPYKELQTFVSYTEDSGKTWSRPRQIAPYANGLCLRRGIKMSNGETLFPVYYTEVYDDFGEFPEFGAEGFWKGTRHMCGAVVTDDMGKSYKPFGNIEVDLNNYAKEIGSPHMWEPNCVEVEDGHIIMYIRCSCSLYLARSESFDYGRTWSKPVETDIPNADAKMTLFKIGKRIFLVSNLVGDITYEGRTRLSIQSSTDGKSWKFVCFVDGEKSHRFYSHAAIDEKKKLVYLSYENGVQHFLNKYTFEELGV